MNHHLTLVALILLSASCHSCFVQITGGIPQGSILQCFFYYFVCERIICGLLTEMTEVSVVKGFDVQSVKMWERSFNDDLKTTCYECRDTERHPFGRTEPNRCR